MATDQGGDSARRGAAAEEPVPAQPGPALPPLPEEGLERALVLVERAAERALAELAELLGGAAVLGLGVAARVALLNELAQRLGQVHLRGLLELHRDEVCHGDSAGDGQHPPPSSSPQLGAPAAPLPARTAAVAPRFRDQRAPRGVSAPPRAGALRPLPPVGSGEVPLQLSRRCLCNSCSACRRVVGGFHRGERA